MTITTENNLNNSANDIAANEAAKNCNVASASRLFDKIIKNYGLKYLRLDKTKGEIILSQVNIPNGFLPSWMLRSDELSVAITGKRLWNAHYKFNEGSLLGYSVSDTNEEFSNESYEQYPLATLEEMPFSIRFLICSMALKETTNYDLAKKTFLPIKDVGYMFEDEKAENGSVIKFSSQDQILSYVAQRLICEESSNIKKILSKNPDTPSLNN